MIKIAFLIDTIESPSAGTEQQLLMLLNNIDRTRFAPFLLCLRNSPWLSAQKFPFPVAVFDITKIASFGSIKFIRAFRHLQAREKFDIVQTYFTDANIAGVITAKLAGVKTILASRRNTGDRLSALQLKALRFLVRYTTKYIANSQAIANTTCEVEGATPEQIEVIYNGMYLERFKSISPPMRARQRAQWQVGENEILIGIVANLRPVKNIESLILSAAILTKKFSNLKFIGVGEGPHRQILHEQIDSLNLSDRFKLVGRYDNIIPCLSAFDIGVLCSKAEGFSNSLIEYMAAGLPIVASDVGGNVEAVGHGKTGLIYSLNNPHGLTDALSQLIEKRQFASDMAAQARKEAFDTYDVFAYIKNHEDFYGEMTDKYSR